jgi:hypothetical protein
MNRPSCDQRNELTPALQAVSCPASPPANAIVQTLLTPERALRNAILFPSGDQRGLLDDRVPCVN